MGERSRHANEVSVAGGARGSAGGRRRRGLGGGWRRGRRVQQDAHTTWLVLLIKDGRGPARNYPLISTPLLCALPTSKAFTLVSAHPAKWKHNAGAGGPAFITPAKIA